jgi:hypothetical protein
VIAPALYPFLSKAAMKSNNFTDDRPTTLSTTMTPTIPTASYAEGRTN